MEIRVVKAPIISIPKLGKCGTALGAHIPLPLCRKRNFLGPTPRDARGKHFSALDIRDFLSVFGDAQRRLAATAREPFRVLPVVAHSPNIVVRDKDNGPFGSGGEI